MKQESEGKIPSLDEQTTSNHSFLRRIYSVPAELREQVYRERTLILQGIYKLSQQGKFPKGTSRMPLNQLAERLKPYPIIQSLVLRTMTDEEWEAYISSPQDKPRTIFDIPRKLIGRFKGKP